MRTLAAGELEAISADEMAELLAAPTPLAFWRRQRGLTQAVLAERAGITQPYLAQIETAKRVGDVGLYRRLARILKLRMEDLVVEERGLGCRT